MTVFYVSLALVWVALAANFYMVWVQWRKIRILRRILAAQFAVLLNAYRFREWAIHVPLGYEVYMRLEKADEG